MIKELKYFFYTITIISFIFFVLNYYFSDQNIKNSYRSITIFDNKLFTNTKNLKILVSDTEKIIDYVEHNLDKDKKKYKFWELISDNEE